MSDLTGILNPGPPHTQGKGILISGQAPKGVCMLRGVVPSPIPRRVFPKNSITNKLYYKFELAVSREPRYNQPL